MKYLIVTTLLFLSLDSMANHYWVNLKAPTKEARTELASFIHIDAVVDDTVYATVNEWAFSKINSEYKNRLINSYLISDSSHQKNIFNNDERFPTKDSAYHTYAQMEATLKKLAQDYPQYATLSSIGQSVEGRELYALTLTHASNTQKNIKNGTFIPTFLFTGSHHAREHLSTEVPLRAAKFILENLEKDSTLKELLSQKKLVFVPMVNPDGAMFDIRGGSYRFWRKNRSEQNRAIGVDLNRNYDNLWGRAGSSTSPNSDVFQGPAPFSEPETQSIKYFVESTPELIGMISFHTYGSLVLHPWGAIYDSIGGEEQRTFERHGREMARLTGYKSQQSSDLYAASGDTCDWAWAHSGVYCYTIELAGRSFYPGVSIIDAEVKTNTNAILYFAKNLSNKF